MIFNSGVVPAKAKHHIYMFLNKINQVLLILQGYQKVCRNRLIAAPVGHKY